jgi:hypothetical protein
MSHQRISFDPLNEVPLILSRETAHELNALICAALTAKRRVRGAEVKLNLTAEIAHELVAEYGIACTRTRYVQED